MFAKYCIKFRLCKSFFWLFSLIVSATFLPNYPVKENSQVLQWPHRSTCGVWTYESMPQDLSESVYSLAGIDEPACSQSISLLSRSDNRLVAQSVWYDETGTVYGHAGPVPNSSKLRQISSNLLPFAPEIREYPMYSWSPEPAMNRGMNLKYGRSVCD